MKIVPFCHVFPVSILLLSAQIFLANTSALFGQTKQTVPKTSVSQPSQQGTPPQASDQNTHRNVIHTEAYKKREHLAEHLSFKVTPPEKRGRSGMVLVEVYNYSKKYLSVVDFWLILKNPWGDLIEVHVTCDDIKPGWSALRWVKIEGNKPFPEITSAEIKNMVIYNEKAQKTNIRYYTDLIKS